MLRNHGDLSHRGPLFILVIWIALALLSCIWLRTAFISNSWQNAVILVVLHAVYLISLIFKGNSTYIQRRTLDRDVSIQLKLKHSMYSQHNSFNVFRNVRVFSVHIMCDFMMTCRLKHWGRHKMKHHAYQN